MSVNEERKEKCFQGALLVEVPDAYRIFLGSLRSFLADIALATSVAAITRSTEPVDGRLFGLRLKDSTEMAGAGCKARLGPLGHLLFI
jgi:hypothetical protein